MSLGNAVLTFLGCMWLNVIYLFQYMMLFCYFVNDDLLILHIALNVHNDGSKFDDFEHHDVFVPVSDVVLSFCDHT